MANLFITLDHNYSCACSGCNVRRNNSVTGFRVDSSRGRDNKAVVIFDRNLSDGSVFIREIRISDDSGWIDASVDL